MSMARSRCMARTARLIATQYRRLRSDAHPDKGGSEARFDEVEQAYRKATER